MPILALDASLARCSAALVAPDGAVLAARHADTSRGHAALLPVMAEQVLAEAGLRATALRAVAAVVGPGSFTGIRAALALAEGLALGAGIPVVGVMTGEALAEAAGGRDREVWVALDNRRGAWFLQRFAAGSLAALNEPEVVAEAALPRPAGPVVAAGDAAAALAARLAARGADVRLSGARLPEAAAVARVAARRLAGALPALPARPVYVEPPAVRPPA